MKALNLKEIFYTNGKFNPGKLSMNSDVFIWLYMDMAKARQLSRFDVMNSLIKKLDEVPELQNRVEYLLAKAIYNALNENEDGGVEFLNGLLQGNYTELGYDKGLIGLYKRFASSTLAYINEPIDEYYKEDLHAFANTLIGSNYMRDLEIYDKFPPVVLDNKEA